MKLIECLGHGYSGSVYKVRLDESYLSDHESGDIYFAMKVFTRSNDFDNKEELKEMYDELHSFKGSDDIFIKPFNFHYFAKDPIEYNTENKDSLGTIDLDAEEGENIIVYFMELLHPLNTVDMLLPDDIPSSLSPISEFVTIKTPEPIEYPNIPYVETPYMNLVNKLIYFCKQYPNVYDNDCFQQVMMRSNGEYMFYDLDGVYFYNDKYNFINNIINVSGWPQYFNYRVYSKDIVELDKLVCDSFIELFKDDIIKSGIILEENITFPEIVKLFEGYDSEDDLRMFLSITV